MEAKTTVPAAAKVSRVEVQWHTVRYRTVVLYFLGAISLILIGFYIVFPRASAVIIDRISEAISPHDSRVSTITARQARFVNLDGKVQVKKVNSVQWTNADYQLSLDKGDLIQTDSEGAARIAFADGTTYTVKGDTLVTVEENNVSSNQPTQVAVHISSGQVDLATGTWEVPGSKAEVSFENAVASLRENSRAAVRSDPATKQQEITISSGSAEFDRGAEHLDIGQWQRVSFPTGGPVSTSQVLAPPDLVEPLNLQPIMVADPARDPVHFSWKPVATAKLYEFQASANMTFNKVIAQKKVATTSVDVTGLEPGNYFWRVRAIDEKNTLSEASEAHKFTLALQGKEQDMLLEVDNTELQGSVVEIIGRTETGAALIVNGEQVADIQPDGHFRYFTQPMTRGSHQIVITGQNRRGGTAIKRVEVVIP